MELMARTSKLEQQIGMCVSCLTCTAVCPVFAAYDDEAVLTNAPAGFFKSFRYMKEWGLDYDAGDLRQALYDCKTCAACEQVCAMVLKVTSMVMELRNRYLEQIADRASLPGRLREALDNTEIHGNPYGPSAWRRDEWAEKSGIKVLSGKDRAEFLYFIGCRPAGRSRKIAEATARVLQKAGVNFGILGDAETCCGNIALTMGDRVLFKKLAGETLQSFKRSGIRRVLVSSPHCYYTLKHQYPTSDTFLEIEHISEFLARLIDENKLILAKPVPKVVTYHDPCYLGRYNRVYNAPRAILKAIPRLKLVEMEMRREDSLCCGGAGTEEWLNRDLERHIAIRRVSQAAATGAEVIVTSCPSCVSVLEEAAAALAPKKKIAVRDLPEIVAKAL